MKIGPRFLHIRQNFADATAERAALERTLASAPGLFPSILSNLTGRVGVAYPWKSIDRRSIAFCCIWKLKVGLMGFRIENKVSDYVFGSQQSSPLRTLAQ